MKLSRSGYLIIAFAVAFSIVKVLSIFGYLGSIQSALAYGEAIFAALLVVVVANALMIYGQLRKRALIEMSKAWIYIIGSSLIFTAATAAGFVFLLLPQILGPSLLYLASLVDWMYFLAFGIMLYGLGLQLQVMKTHAEAKAFFTDLAVAPKQAPSGTIDSLGKWLGDEPSKFRVIPIIVTGNIPISVLMGKIVNLLKASYTPVLMLGPTNPLELKVDGMKALWVTDVEEKLPNVITAPPKALTEISIFVTGATKVPDEVKPILVGDFLDNVLPHIPLTTLNSFYSVMVNKFKSTGKTLIVFLQAGLHEETKMTLVKRFADALIELRESEVKGKRVEEIKVSNFVSRVYKEWEVLKPEDIFSSR